MTLPIPSHLKVRDARDRIIDSLGFGQTYPLRDVDVQDEQLTVNFNEQSAIDIVPGQCGVTYALYPGDVVGNPPSVDPLSSVKGNGTLTRLAGPLITQDITFRILATKIGSPDRHTFLNQSALFKVGLNTKLRAFMLGVPALNPTLVGPEDTDPRIVDYGSTVTVRVAGSQSGARYSLVYTDGTGTPVATNPIPGNGADIDLDTSAITEDTQIRVRVTRTFDPAEGRSNLDALLDAALTLAVRANPAVAISVQGSAQDGLPLVDPIGPVTLTIFGSQKSVVYSAYLRQLLDPDFEVNDTGDPTLLSVAVPTADDMPGHSVYVHAPLQLQPFQVQNGYAQQGDITAGNGGALKLNLKQIHDDSVLLVQAKKMHLDPKTLQPLGSSAVQLKQPAVILPRPDPVAALALAASVVAAGPGATMLVTGGQRGVFYHFRLPVGSAEIGFPAYFHRVDEQDALLNRGIGQVRLGTDFVVARTPPDASGDLTQKRPLTALIELTQLPAGSTLSVTAVWARTGVAWLAASPVPITKT